MAEIVQFPRKTAVKPPVSLRQGHLRFCADDLSRLFQAAAHFMNRDADYHFYYADKLKNIRALQRDNILPVHADMGELHEMVMAEDFAGVGKIERSLQLVINQIESDCERWQMTQAEWIKATGAIDCVKTSILQDTTDLLVQAQRDILMHRQESRELVRLAEKNPDGLIEYTIDFIDKQYKGPAEFYLQDLIGQRFNRLGLKQHKFQPV